MTDRKPDGAETAVREHVRQILAQISALKDRLRDQEQAKPSGSRDAVEVDREGDRASRIDYAYLPA